MARPPSRFRNISLIGRVDSNRDAFKTLGGIRFNFLYITPTVHDYARDCLFGTIGYAVYTARILDASVSCTRSCLYDPLRRVNDSNFKIRQAWDGTQSHRYSLIFLL